MENGEPSALLARVVEALRAVGGVDGVVLGGSRARGTHAPDSDHDIGVYYADEAGLDLPALAEAAGALDDERRDGLIAPPGAWGKWVNGGGWLAVDGARVDLILRDLRRVEQAVADCERGVVAAHYQAGHPHAYVDAMYAGELAVAKILWDRDGRLRALRGRTLPYPEALKNALFRLFDFEAGFSAMLAKASAGRGDDYYVAAHVVRALSCLNQALFALNGEYCINEKGAVRMIDGFALKPRDYARRVARVAALTGNENDHACALLEALVSEMRELEGG